ncbi:uncharacterized protein [Centroberyx affinis]|uniref:uncharacterized protein isoform X1 n=1 Tax=Centroberyx affinis TaxID=166261 RepID=UPI003A5C53E6
MLRGQLCLNVFQYHITIRERSRLPPVQKCTQCCSLYHCPLCSSDIYKPTHRYKVNKHLNSHISRAIQHQGYNICKCNLGCRPEAHFHCFCEKLFLNRNQFIHHLNTKHQAAPTPHPSVSTGVEDEEGDDDDGGPAEVTSPLSPSSADQPNAPPGLTTDALGSAAANDEPDVNWTSGGDAPAKCCPAKTEPKNRVACPQCNLVVNKKSLSKHIQVKHPDGTAHVTSSSHLRGAINLPTEFPGGSERPQGATPVQLEILTQLRVLQQQQSQILLLLQKLTNTDGGPDPAPAGPEDSFPIADEDGLAALELKLSEDPDLKNRLMSFFGSAEGVPIDQTVQRILERMLSNPFARRMSWKGENNKVSFASSSLKEIVNESVRRNSVCARAADTAVESAVRRWLQRAGEREEGGEERGGEQQ